MKRVRPHVQDLRPRCDAAVVYGGEEVQQRAHGRLVPWRLVGSAAPPRTDPCVRVFAGDRPLAGADVRVERPDGMRKSAETDERGVAAFDVRPGHEAEGDAVGANPVCPRNVGVDAPSRGTRGISRLQMGSATESGPASTSPPPAAEESGRNVFAVPGGGLTGN